MATAAVLRLGPALRFGDYIKNNVTDLGAAVEHFKRKDIGSIPIENARVLGRILSATGVATSSMGLNKEALDLNLKLLNAVNDTGAGNLKALVSKGDECLEDLRMRATSNEVTDCKSNPVFSVNPKLQELVVDIAGYKIKCDYDNEGITFVNGVEDRNGTDVFNGKAKPSELCDYSKLIANLNVRLGAAMNEVGQRSVKGYLSSLTA